ncbi:MAG: carbohydrate ABC transporter permease [Spirochaetales bacterium]|nr:carbohydrate ABC transporter permease [Spirochaetales bacterium]
MKKRTKTIIQNVILLLIVLLTIFPLFWTFLTSIKANVDAWSMPPKFVFSPTFKNYSIVLFDKGFFGYIRNSLITCVFATAFAMLLGIPLAYSLSRLKSRFKNVVFVGVFVSYILPPIVLSIPLYVIFAKWGILNKYSTIILTHTTFILAFTAWMMRGFFEEVPEEIEESAILDGCSFMECLLRIDIPMVKAGLVSTVIFSFILSWNDFMYALVLTSQSTRLVSVAVAQFLTPHGMFWGQMCAAGIIAILPILIFTLFARKSLVRGMSIGAIK